MSSDTPIDPKHTRHFSNHVPYPFQTSLYDFLHRPNTVTSLRTATAMGRPAVEGISESLVNEFGGAINQPAVKQVIGHVVKQIMEALGYAVDKLRMRTGSGIFSTGILFRPPTPAGPDAFNRWLDAQVRSPDGEFDPEKMAALARKWGVEFSAKPWSAAMRRLGLGALLRRVVPPSNWESTEACAGSREPDESPFPGVPDDRAGVEAGRT